MIIGVNMPFGIKIGMVQPMMPSVMLSATAAAPLSPPPPIARGGPEAEPETTHPPHAFGERAGRDVVADAERKGWCFLLSWQLHIPGFRVKVGCV